MKALARRLGLARKLALIGLLWLGSQAYMRDANGMIDVWIDPGHGGPDPGNVGFDGNGFPNEKDITLAVSLDLQNSLAGLFLEAHLTHTTDDSLSLIRRGLITNGVLPNDEDVQDSAFIFVSVHTNANKDNQVKGTETYFWRSKNDKSVFSSSGMALAQTVHTNMINSFALVFGAPNFCHSDRHIKSANYAVLRESHAPAILIELCFTTNQCQENLVAVEATNPSLPMGWQRGSNIGSRHLGRAPLCHPKYRRN